MATAQVKTQEIRLKKQLVGVVISDKMDKTVVVRTDRRMAHPVYQKVIVVSKKFKAHDEKNEAKIGDTVRISQTRPLSKTKRWTVVGMVTKAAQEAKPVKSEENIKATAKAKAKAKATAKRKK